MHPLVNLQQLWRLALAWHESRMTIEARRPQPEEMRDIFALMGLEGPFRDPKVHSLG